MAQRAEEGGVWGRGEGRSGVGEGPCADAAPPLRAALAAPALPHRGGRLHSAYSTPPSPLSPSQWKQTALDLAKQENYTEIVTLLLASPLTATV